MIPDYQSQLNLNHRRFNPLPAEAQLDLLVRAKQGEARARERLIETNMRFVLIIARKFLQPPFTIDELINEGVIGLDKAIDRFELGNNAKFLSYAVWWIRQGIIRAIQDTGSLIRRPIPYSIRNSPECIEASERAKQCCSLSVLQDLGWDPPSEDEDPTATAEANSSMAYFRKCSKDLSFREQDILWKHAGFSNGTFIEKTSMRHLSRTWGISEQRVRTIRDRAVEKLQEAGLFSEIA